VLTGLIIGVVGVLCGIAGLLYAIRQTGYARQQTKLMEDDLRERRHEENEDYQWAERHERLMNQILQINPQLKVQLPGVPLTYLYTSIFPDAMLRKALETYVVQLDSSQTRFLRMTPRPDELRRTNLRDTVKKAEECMADFQKRNPKIDLNYYMGFQLSSDT
jgi:hypothetical protein